MNINDYYFAGVMIVGLPMAIASVIFYKWGEDFDSHKSKPYLKLIRNFLYPGSFLMLPDYENQPRRNNQSSYEGPIGAITDKYDFLLVQSIFYCVISSFFWPLRLSISVTAICFLGATFGVALIVKSLSWLYRLLSRSL